MARTFTRNSRNYAAGTYGPFTLDTITRDDTDFVRATFTVEAWDPLADPILSATITWSDGTPFPVTFSGAPMNRDGTPATTVGFSADVPRVAGPDGQPTKVPVDGASIVLTAHVPIRTAITFGAGTSSP